MGFGAIEREQWVAEGAYVTTVRDGAVVAMVVDTQENGERPAERNARAECMAAAPDAVRALRALVAAFGDAPPVRFIAPLVDARAVLERLGALP